MATNFPTGLLLGEPESDLLLGAYELTERDRAALMRRHNAALNLLKETATVPERMEILHAVVWPSRDLRETVAAIDAGERQNV